MSLTSISATLTPADRDAVINAVAIIKAKLPFLVDLTVDDRKALPKMGDKSRAFVSKALEVATQNPDFLPRAFDLEEMRRDVQLFEAMYPIVMALTQLQELLDDIALRSNVRTVLESSINTITKTIELIPTLPHPIL